MERKKQKVIVVGLPKTGTSTIAAMLRMLEYKVTGPDIKYKNGNYEYLDNQFGLYDAFQDYPWCFEWHRYFDDFSTKFIVLKRDRLSWWKSFYDSYGNKNENYLSYSYFNILKEHKNQKEFLDYFDAYYLKVESYAQNYPERFLNIDIKTFEWKDLCSFLNESTPTNLLGKVAEKPHVNKQNHTVKKSLKFKVIKKLKNYFYFVLGEDIYFRVVVFFRKNGII